MAQQTTTLQQLVNTKGYNNLSYREGIYMIKDIIAKLVEHGELTLSALVAYCGLHMTKHRKFIDQLESRNLITRIKIIVGKRSVTLYKVTPKGIKFYDTILEPYEAMIPRTG